jgi:hypothetical protein
MNAASLEWLENSGTTGSRNALREISREVFAVLSAEVSNFTKCPVSTWYDNPAK